MHTSTTHIPTEIQFLLIGIVFLTLCPLLSIPFIVYGIYHQQKGAYALLSLLLGVFAFISAPSGDLYRHYCQYNYFAIRPFSSITWVDISLNGVLPCLYWIMARANIGFSYLRFFELSVGFYLICNIFNYMINTSNANYSKKDTFIRFALLFLFFDFLYTTMGVKFGFALCTYLYSLHLVLNKQKWTTGIIFFVITCMWHSSFLFTGPFVYAIYLIKPQKKSAIILCILLAIVIPLIISIIGVILFGRRFDFYFSNKADNVTSYSAMTKIGLLLYILPKLTIIPFAIILLRKYVTESAWCRIALGWFMLSVILITNAVAFYRFWWAFMSIGVFLILDLESKNGLFASKTIHKLVICGILFTALNCLVYHKEIIYSNYYRSIYPIPLVINSDYEKRWVLKNIQYDGDF